MIKHYDSDPSVQIKACTQLGTFLVHKEPNMRMLALEGLEAMAQTEFSRDAVKKHQATVLKQLKVRRADVRGPPALGLRFVTTSIAVLLCSWGLELRF